MFLGNLPSMRKSVILYSIHQCRHTLFNQDTKSCLAIVTQVLDWTALTCAVEVATSGSLASGQPFA